VLAQPKTAIQPLSYSLPALGVIVSGGHTEFVLVTKLGQYQKLGQTIDDAAGEALDKVGRMLDLGYPAGPVLEEFAKKGNPEIFEFPLPMTTSQDFNLSFSGLKTFSRNLIAQLEAVGPLQSKTVYDLAASFQYAVFRHVCHKLAKVLAAHPEIQEVWLGGGVAANTKLRQQIRHTIKQQAQARKLPPATLRIPYTKKLCGDNAAMIGLVAGLTNKKPPRPELIERKPRWSVVS
jgi:N6-L-threonylcarbamoyladenine synthase